tara:strand:+ start:1359 stop:2501 length:1143 start_codon:yes stop_codon:yes gene_type:complete
MATSFKNFDPGRDSVVTRNLLHEAIPITGTIVSGTYGAASIATGSEGNIKNYSHGMFQSVYDYPYLSSSANHIFDITCGFSSQSTLSQSAPIAASQQAKKINVYTQMAQVLAGFDENGAVREFDDDGDLTGGTKIREAYFINFARLLSKDEIKKGSFSLSLGVSGTYGTPFGGNMKEVIRLTDYSGSSGYKVNSPAGEYGILYATGAAGGVSTPINSPDNNGRVKAGLIYYQAGIAVITASVFGISTNGGLLRSAATGTPMMNSNLTQIDNLLSASAISGNANSLRHRIEDISFNNTTELNSTVYFCRVNNSDFNYSANPTYLSSSKMVVKNNSQDVPVSYVTSVGMYSADNELLAVAKLSEPLKKDPATEFTLRVRLDY